MHTVRDAMDAVRSASVGGGSWDRLRHDAHRVIRGLARRECEDVVGDAVLLAFQRFGPEPRNWSEVFGWLVAVARRLAARRWRQAAIVRLDATGVVDATPARASEPALPRAAVLELAAELRATLLASDNETLDLLLAGQDDNQEIARVRGRRLRAVQASRARIAQAARAWILSRRLQVRRIFFSMRAAPT